MGPGLRSSAGAWVFRQSVRRGLLGSSRIWFVAFVATGTVKVLKRVMRSREPSVLSEDLEPGAGLEVRHLDKDRG